MSQYTEKLTVQITNKNEDIPRLMLAVSGNKSAYAVAFVYNTGFNECLLIVRKRGNQSPMGWHVLGSESPVVKQLDTQQILTGDYQSRLSQLEQVSQSLGEIHYKGSWSATLELEEQLNGTVEALLIMSRTIGNRKLVISGHFKDATLQWECLVQRGAHWAAEPVTVQKKKTQHTLKAIIELTLNELMNTTANWCAVKENTRRASMDAEYAKLHPINPGKEAKPKPVSTHFEKVKAEAESKKPASQTRPKAKAKSADAPQTPASSTAPQGKGRARKQEPVPNAAEGSPTPAKRNTTQHEMPRTANTQPTMSPEIPVPGNPQPASQNRIEQAAEAITDALDKFLSQRKKERTPQGDDKQEMSSKLRYRG